MAQHLESGRHISTENMQNAYPHGATGVDRESRCNNESLGQNPRGSGLTQFKGNQRGRGDNGAERIQHARLDAVRFESDPLDLKTHRSRLDSDRTIVEHQVETMPFEQRRLQAQLDFKCVGRLNQDSSGGWCQDVEGSIGSEKRVIARARRAIGG